MTTFAKDALLFLLVVGAIVLATLLYAMYGDHGRSADLAVLSAANGFSADIGVQRGTNLTFLTANRASPVTGLIAVSVTNRSQHPFEIKVGYGEAAARHVVYPAKSQVIHAGPAAGILDRDHVVFIVGGRTWFNLGLTLAAADGRLSDDLSITVRADELGP